MAEHKKLSMLVKLDDGQTYTLGGDGADNAVTLDTEQTITGLKTFDKLPQSSVKPANDHDLVNKVYVDALKPKLKTTVMLNVEDESTNWVAFHSIKFSTTTGKFIEPVYLEDTSTSTAVEPLKFVFRLADSFTANATAKNKDFFKDYQLQDGEYFGSFTPSHLLDARWSIHTSSEQANPFSNYLASLTSEHHSVLPYLEYNFDGLSDELKQVDFSIGDIYNSNKYPPKKFQFVVNTGAKEFTSKVYTKDADGIGQGSHHTVEFKLKDLEYVTLDTKQEITGVKTFTQNIKVTAKPSAPNDVATVGYISGQLNAKAPYEVTLDFKVEAKTADSWVVYSNMEINLDNGKKLKCIHIDNTQPTVASAPVKAVFKAIPATEAINAAPTEQAPTFFDTYQLQDEEYLGTLTYGHILNPQLQDYSSYKGPFHTNQYGTTCTIKEATQLRVSLSELPAAVSKVSLQFSSSYLPKTFKASMSGVGLEVTSNVLSNPSGYTPLELLFDVVKLTGLVTLDTAQTITGAKTFEKLPKSEATPKDDADLITKKFADSHYLPFDTKLHKYDILVKMKHDGTSWVGFSDFSVRLRDGTRLDVKHIENQPATTATQPVKAVFKTVKDLTAPIEAPTQQPATFFDSYSLEAGEFTGTVSFYKAVGQFGPASYDINPWYVYVGYGNGNNYDGIYAVSINNLDKPLLGVNFKFGDAHTTETYTCLQCGVVFTVDGSALEVAYDGDMADGVEATIEYPINAKSMIGFVTVDTQQELTALKTFKVLPQSEAVPADDKDLVNKKYVDEKVGAGGGTGGAAPANMVTTDTAQNITEVKTFDKLPKSSVEPTDDTELVNKKYVDSKAGSAGANVVTLDTEQSITAVKTFEKLPKSDAVPADANELVNKAYVDAAAKSLQGYEITIFGKTGTTNNQLGFKKLKLFFANGYRLYPLYQADDVSLPSETPVPFIWTLDYPNLNSDDPYAMSKSSTDIAQYELRGADFKGSLTTPNKLGSFTIGRDSYFYFGYNFRVYGNTTDKQGVIKFEVLGSLPPITKIELVTDSDTNWQGSAISAEIRTIGGETKASQEVSITGVDQKIELTFEEAFKVDPLYVNRFDDQDVFGSKTFKSVPKIDKDPATYGIADANESTTFGDLYGSAAIAKPVSQSVNFYISTSEQRKAPTGGSVWQTKYTCTVQIYNFAPKIRRPDTYEEAQLYLKAVGPSSEGYRGILSLEKPSNYPQLDSIQEMDSDTMNAYKLQPNEYFCKLQYLTGSGNRSRTEEALNNALKSGSDKIKQLFSNDASEWWTYTSSWHRDLASAHNPDDIPWAVVNLFIYNAPVLCAVNVYNNSSYTNRQFDDTLNVTSAASYANVQTSEDLYAVNWAQKVGDVQMCSVDVLAAIRALQKTNTALEARIKALEDAAAKPQY